VFQAECEGKKIWPMINDQDWLERSFIPTVQKRGAAIIDARGLSSAASAANAAMDHVRNWIDGTRARQLGQHGIPSDGSYGIPEGVIYGYPSLRGRQVQDREGAADQRVQPRAHDATLKELQEERDGIGHLIA